MEEIKHWNNSTTATNTLRITYSYSCKKLKKLYFWKCNLFTQTVSVSVGILVYSYNEKKSWNFYSVHLKLKMIQVIHQNSLWILKLHFGKKQVCKLEVLSIFSCLEETDS